MNFLRENQTNRIWQTLAVTLVVVLGVFCGVGGVGVAHGAVRIYDANILDETLGQTFGFQDTNGTEYFLSSVGGKYSVMRQIQGVQDIKTIDQASYDKLLASKDPTSVKAAYTAAPAGPLTVGGLIGQPGAVSTGAAANNDGARNVIGTMVAWVLYYIASGLGAIMVLVAKVMLTVAVFNNFIGQAPVQAGWAILRDLCNNFFIIFMLIMAGGIALNLSNYSLKAMLPKILTAAILINFSLMFTGILIDVSQIVMLTFAGPLANSTGYGLILKSMGLPDAYSMTALMDTNSPDPKLTDNGNLKISTWDIVVALLFAIIVTIVAIVVIGAIAVILVYRIVMLMFLAVLSPLPYLARAGSNIKQLASISGEWNSLFFKMLTVGPAMMFFLYIAFLFFATPMLVDDNALRTAEATQKAQDVYKPATGKNVDLKANSATNFDVSSKYAAISGMGTVSGLLKFMLTIGFLFGALRMGQTFGDKAGSYASGAQGWLTKQGKKFSGFNLAGAGLKKAQEVPGKAIAKVGTGALGLTSATLKGIGSGNQEGGLYKLGAFGSQWRDDVLGARRKARTKSLDAIMGKMGLGSADVKEKWGEFTDTKFAKNIKTVATTASGALAATGAIALTGGAGILPGVATAAAAYFGGGGRLMEMWLGQKGIARAKEREEEQKKINAVKDQTKTDVDLSETKRNQDIETGINTHFAGASTADKKAKKDYDDAKKRMADIEATKLTDKNKTTGSGMDKEVTDALTAGGWKKGDEITEEMLEQAINKAKTGATWTGLEANVATFEASANGLKIKSIKDTEEVAHKKRVDDQLDKRIADATASGDTKGAELIKVEKKRYDTEYTAKAKLDVDTKKIANDLQDKLDEIDRLALTNGHSALQVQKDKKKEEEKSAILTTAANKTYTDKIATVQHKEPKANIGDRILEDYKPYAHENWVSQAVAKDAAKNKLAIKNLITAMRDAGADVLDGFEQIAKGNFYSGSGQTEQQFNTIKALTASNADATKAISNLIDSLTAMPAKLTGQQAQLVKELKQGIAAYKKAGGDTSKLSAVITLLDQKTGSNKGKTIDDKTVAQYETEIKPKK